jgi:hypothetical protein
MSNDVDMEEAIDQGGHQSTALGIKDRGITPAVLLL